jgi:hypothetical protein
MALPRFARFCASLPSIEQRRNRNAQKSLVCWEELPPAEFEARLAELPVVYLPLGLCEPHGKQDGAR